MEITFEVTNLPTSEVCVLRVNSTPVAVLLKTTLSLFSIWDMYEMFEYYQENRHTSKQQGCLSRHGDERLAWDSVMRFVHLFGGGKNSTWHLMNWLKGFCKIVPFREDIFGKLHDSIAQDNAGKHRMSL